MNRQAQNILFLGYDESKTRLIGLLNDKGCKVTQTDEKVQNFENYDLVICFGYRHIITPEAMTTSKRDIINLHISYLPFNRGAHPNFWSFFDGTPSGVTIHCVDEGVDTGEIIFQRLVNFDKNENKFIETYQRLIAEIEDLFERHLDQIITGRFPKTRQRGRGTHHFYGDLPKEFSGWNAVIADEIQRLDGIFSSTLESKLKLIDEIEKVRTRNNVNWMDLLRLAYTQAPVDAAKLVRKINSDDMAISDLFKQLGE